MNYTFETIKTYNDLDWWATSFFADGGPGLLIIVGAPGLSKSQTFQRAAGDGTLYLGGALSAFHLYTQLYHHRDQPVVIDDVDALFKDKASVNLLKSLGNTDSVRTLFWGKRAKQLDDEGVPHRFQTSSRVCILANTLARIEENFAAVLDRAFVLQFAPSAAEVHRRVGQWFQDTEVYAFVGLHLPLITQASMRHYVKASELKAIGGDWKGWLIKFWTAHDPLLGVVARIMADESLMTAPQRVARFAELTGGRSRATYMRYQKRFRALTRDRDEGVAA